MSTAFTVLLIANNWKKKGKNEASSTKNICFSSKKNTYITTFNKMLKQSTVNKLGTISSV